ncbi:MAG: hypothetical protein KDB27_07290 [Planctomycetales bacterium]|nr:hypothetical protein [Planctomycetales bacterium]
MTDESNRNDSAPKTSRIYKAPKRFDVATILVVTSAYASFIAVFRALEVGIHNAVVWLVFLTSVGIVQMLTPERDVRVAAAMTGVAFCLAFRVYADVIVGPYSSWLDIAAPSLTVGPIIGYLGGVLVAGVFLISDKLRNFLFGRSSDRTAE